MLNGRFKKTSFVRIWKFFIFKEIQHIEFRGFENM